MRTTIAVVLAVAATGPLALADRPVDGSLQAAGDAALAPPAFEMTGGGTAVFVDFLGATYELTFDYQAERVVAVSTIEFEQPATGFALFDLVPEVEAATLDGRPVEVATVESPDGVTAYRVIREETAAGPHRLVVSSSFDRGVRSRDGAMSAGLFVNDWDDRAFLEMYLPSNLEYDSYRMTVDVRMVGTSRAHEVFANAATIEEGRADNTWHIVFPDFYNASHVYLHVVPEGDLERRSFEFASAFRPFEVTVYGSSITDRVIDAVDATLQMLETALGPWPHERLLVHLGRPGRSMEYAGATWTTLGALRHELAHSYMGRWIAPASGDASWFDEAAVTWLIDRQAPVGERLPRGAGRIGAVSPYFRATHQSSYGQGSEVMAHIDYLLRQQGDGATLLGCLRRMAQQQGPAKLGTAGIQGHLEACYGDSLQPLFDAHVYGRR